MGQMMKKMSDTAPKNMKKLRLRLILTQTSLTYVNCYHRYVPNMFQHEFCFTRLPLMELAWSPHILCSTHGTAPVALPESDSRDIAKWRIPWKNCESCLAPKNHQVSFHGHFFFSPTGPVSSHHPITTITTPGKAGPAFALRNIFAKGLGEDRIDAANLPEARGSLRELRVSQKMGKGWKTPGSSTKKSCLKTDICPTSEENSKRESETGQNSVVF